MALPSVCLSLLSPSSLAASVLRSLPARSTKLRVETCKKRLRQFDEKPRVETCDGEEALGTWMCPRAGGRKRGEGCWEQTFTGGTLPCYSMSLLGCMADKGRQTDACTNA